MRIGIDARELEGHPTGVGRVVEGLLGCWPEDDEIVLFSRGEIDSRGILRDNWEHVVAPGPAGLPGTLWEQAVLPGKVRRARCDLLVSPAYGMPYRPPCPVIVGMHDCAFAALPETFRPRERVRRRVLAAVAARQAAFLFAGSEFAADEAGLHLDIDRTRMEVLPYGVTRRFVPADPDVVAAARDRYRLPGRMLLFVGSHLTRRGLPGMPEIVSTAAAAHADVELCRLGVQPPDTSADAGRWLGYVDEADLPAIYTAAEAVLYPSRYEGFGLPVMEALACGVPVLASTGTALGEIYAGRARLLDHDDRDAWTEAIRAVLDDPDAARLDVAEAAVWARGRTWEDAATRLRARAARVVRAA